MTCAEVREWLSAEMDCETSPEEPAAVRRHLEACLACQRARLAGEALRCSLFEAARMLPSDAVRDEQVLAALRSEGICHAPGGGRALWGRVGTIWQRLSAEPAPSLRPALAALAASFLLTWGALHWAETSAPGLPRPPALSARARPSDTEMLERWLAGSPSLAALSRLQRAPAPQPERRTPSRSGAMPGGRERPGWRSAT